MVRNSNGSACDSLTLQWYKSNMSSVEAMLCILDLDLFLGWRYDPLWWRWAKAASCSAMLVSSQHPDTCSAPGQPFCFPLSVQHAVNYVGYSTLHYKTGFLLDNFAHLQANVSVLNMFKVGKGKLWCLVVRSIKCFSTYNGFIGT